MTTNRKPPRSPGRPAGSPNVKDAVIVQPSRCLKCGSSRRGPYQNTQRRDYRGTGTEFVEIIYRRCQCLDCEQWRVDREHVYEGRPRDDDQLDQANAAA
ncbi:MAG: hypothetical protein QOH21_3634 [Acidobacteriota bacterium]|jgi:hypothetical protein|nr:hypothetical protein [Acidobacteriota bacterium]